jgi:8-oxo-dGTP pyrophosphatase MutT (NUDIX family)
MGISTEEIGTTTERYLQRFPAERTALAALLDGVFAGGDLTSRKQLPGHVTCGAVVVDPGFRVLHIRHNALDRWLLPGGHLEPSETSLPAAALRELGEETAITPEQLAAPEAFSAVPVDIDAHPIPANPAKGEPDHWHYDFRYLFVANELGTEHVHLQAEEVHDHEWLDLAAMPALRLRDKLIAMRRAIGY